MAREETVFQCLNCECVTRVASKPPRCGKCGSGNGVLRPATRGAAFGERQDEEEEVKKV